MKRLLPSCLLGIALVASSTACTKHGTSPDPVPVPSGPANRWTGKATYTYQLDTNLGSSIGRVDVTITWAKATNPNPAPPAGSARYVVESGAAHVTWQESIEIGHTRCTVQQEGDFPITPNPSDPESQSLDLGADGQYQGMLYAPLTLPVLQRCSDGLNFNSTRDAGLGLDIKGTLDGGRMRGEMPPRILPGASATSTRKGSWDFAAN
jgi:hypothetical protein